MNTINLPEHFDSGNVFKGNQGEHIVAYLLKKNGYFVTCLSDINENGKGGAPGMSSSNKYLALPDLQAAMNGKLGYCEVKWKTEPTYTIMTGRLEHGVDKVNWQHYLEIGMETGAPVFLFIYERKTGDVLYNHIEFLEKCPRYSPGMGKGGMMFWDRDSFYRWSRIVPVSNDMYEQISIFDVIEGVGDKLFKVVFDK